MGWVGGGGLSLGPSQGHSCFTPFTLDFDSRKGSGPRSLSPGTLTRLK